MNYKGVLFFLGIYSLFVSLFFILNILYSIYFNFDFTSYLISLGISLTAGSLFCSLGRKYIKNISIYDQIILIVSSFIFLPLLICLPYFLSDYNISFLNSYFESVSGFTTTGFSIINNVEKIDEPLLLWRSSSQWLGGLFFLVAIIGTLGLKTVKIKPAYLISGASLGGNFYNNFSSNFAKILLIYFFTTIFIIFLFNFANIRLFDSFNLAFTAISSGGFLPKNSLSSIVTNNFKILVLSISLLFPIFNFYLFFKIFSNQFKIQDHQEDLHLGIIIIILSLLFYFFFIPNEGIVDVFLAITS